MSLVGEPSSLSRDTQPAPVDVSRHDPEVLVDVRNLSIRFPVGRTGFWGRQVQFVHAVEDVSFTIRRGQTLGLVGESGSGKTTTGRAVLRRLEPSAGTIGFRGQDITRVKGEQLRTLRCHMQLVFQDPYASLNPRMTVGEIVAEPLLVHGLAKSIDAARPEVQDLLDRCGLPSDAIDRYPHAFSGGQRQRVGIARALALDPELLVADESVSALDVSVQAQVLDLLQDLQKKLNIAIIFITHDLRVAAEVCDKIAVMYRGAIVEFGPPGEVFNAPRHAYTQQLIAAIPGRHWNPRAAVA